MILIDDDDVSDRSSPELPNIPNDQPPSPQRVTKRKGISKKVFSKENQEDSEEKENTLITTTSLNPREVSYRSIFVLTSIYFSI